MIKMKTSLNEVAEYQVSADKQWIYFPPPAQGIESAVEWLRGLRGPSADAKEIVVGNKTYLRVRLSAIVDYFKRNVID